MTVFGDQTGQIGVEAATIGVEAATIGVEATTIGRAHRHEGVGASESPTAAQAAREAVLQALNGRVPSAGGVLLLFVSTDYEVEDVYRAAVDAAAPAHVVGCTSTGGFTHLGQVPSGCVAAYLGEEEMSIGVCHVERDDDAIAECTQRAAEVARSRAGLTHKHSVLVLLTDGLTPDQREVARGAYHVASARVPFVGGAAGDALTWTRTLTFGEDRILDRGILALWINSAQPLAVSVGHGWRPAGRPMLVTRAEGTIVRELDGAPALDAYLAEVAQQLEPDDPEFFLRVLRSPVGIPNARGRYDVRQLHAYLPAGGGVNFNTGISDHSILQIMEGDDESLLSGARDAAAAAAAQLPGAPRLALVFSCGSRSPLLGDRIAEETAAISEQLKGAAVCGFYTYGEFARVDGSSGVHNSSVALLVI